MSMQRTDPSQPFATAIEPRCGFLRPTLRIPHRTGDDWSAIPRITPLANEHGETTFDDVDLRIAWDEQAIHLQAVWSDDAPVMRPDVEPGTANFWKQDHVDLRLTPDAEVSGSAVAFLFTLAGRWFDGLDLWKSRSGVRFEATSDGDERRIEASVAWADLPFGKPAPGERWHGLISHIRFKQGGPRIAGVSPADLGFAHQPRFIALEFLPDAGPTVVVDRVAFETPLLRSGANPATVELVNRGQAALPIVLRVEYDREPDASPISLTTPHELAPGRNTVELDIALERPTYRRVRLACEAEGRAWPMLETTLRGAPQPLGAGVAPLTHPYLEFDAEGLAELRARAQREPFAKMTGEITVTEADLDPPDLPAEGEKPSLLITPDAMGWSRVAKETMIRDGEGGRKKTAAYLWSLQSEPAKEAWRATKENVEPTEAQRQLLIDELNAMLARRDFYDPEVFEGVSLPNEALEMLERGVDALSEDELFKLNRIVLQSSVECIRAYKANYNSLPGACWSKWLITGDDRLIATATRAVRAANAVTLVGPYIDLHEGGACAALARAYDSFAPHLDAEARADWLTLLGKMLRMYLRTARESHWNTTTVPNANPVCNGGAGTLALALLNEMPEEAAEALHYARTRIRNWLDYCDGPDGGNTEGAQYWQYGTENYIRFARCLERVTGSDDGLLSHPAIRNAMNMVRVGLTNDGAMHGVNDTIPVPVGGAIGWFIGRRFNDPFGTWYGDHALRWVTARRDAGKKTPYSPSPLEMLIDRADVPEITDPPPMPTAFALPSIEYAILRSRPTLDAPLVAGLKGSRPPYTHHNQPDSGAIFLDLRGERLLIDPGYYNGAPSDHCLPLVDGVGPHQPNDYTARLDACDAVGLTRWAVCDATPAYRGAARRVRRTMIMLGDGLVLLVDDIQATGEGAVTAQYQAGNRTELIDKAGRTMRIHGQAATLDVALLTHDAATFELKPQRDWKTHWGYIFSDCLWHPATASYTADPREPLVTAIADATEGQPTMPTVAWDRDAEGRAIAMQIDAGAAGAVRLTHSNDQWDLDLATLG